MAVTGIRKAGVAAKLVSVDVATDPDVGGYKRLQSGAARRLERRMAAKAKRQEVIDGLKGMNTAFKQMSGRDD